MAGAFAASRAFGTEDGSESPLVRFGLVTDVHYADINTSGSGATARHYRDSLLKLAVAVEDFNRREEDFVAELDDFKDLTNGRDGTLAALERIEAEFAKFNGPRYHVPGNHDFDCLTEEEFYSRTPNGGSVGGGYYSFVRNGVTFIVLDGCYTSDAKHYSPSISWSWKDSNIPPDEMEWLGRELAAAQGHVVVFCHQRLDPASDQDCRVKNAAAVRSLLESSGKVRAVLTGHEHVSGQDFVNGIPYYTLGAMVSGAWPDANCYAEAVVYPSGKFAVASTASFTADAVGEGPDRKLKKGETPPVAYFGDDWAGDLSKVAKVMFTPPEGSGLANTTWNRTGKGAEPFTFNAKGVWTLTLTFADNTTRTAHTKTVCAA